MSDLTAARRDLEAALGADAVLADPLALRLYARDASMVEGSAGLVVFPRSADDVAACMRDRGRRTTCRWCRAAAAPASPAAATPIGDALVVVTTKMNRILEVRAEDRLAWVEPGVFNLDLGTALAPTGFTYAPDPSSQQVSSIGGNVEHERRRTALPGLRRDERPRPGARRRAARRLDRAGSAAKGPAAAGYDLRGVVVGSEGTLGIVTAVCVRLTPIAPAVRTMLLDFERVEDCAATVSAIVARGVVPAALEMMDRGIVRAVENFAHAGYPTDAAAVLLVEVDGLEAAVEAQAREVEAAAREHGVGTVRVAADEAERALLWKGRKSAFGAIAQIAPHYHLHDCVVPRTKLAEVLAGVYAIAKHHDLIVTNVFHAGDGNLHPLFSFDLSVPGTLERVLAAADELVRLCVDAGGALSGEHGIGLEKRDFMPLVFTEEDLERAGVRARGVRPRRADEPAQGAARRRAVRRLRGRSVGARRRAPGGHMDLIHPHTPAEVAEPCAPRAPTAPACCSSAGASTSTRGTPSRSTPSCGRRGWTARRLRPRRDARASSRPACGSATCAELLAEGGQEWPVDAPSDATVGGVIAADVALPRQLRVGHAPRHRRRDGGRHRRRPSRALAAPAP